MAATKRSMSIRSCPIGIYENGKLHRPDDRDARWVSKSGEYYRKWTGPWGYVVARVTNSTNYRPGFLLTKQEVDDLIDTGWTVSILSDV